jgi:hypothetical protein
MAVRTATERYPLDASQILGEMHTGATHGQAPIALT